MIEAANNLQRAALRQINAYNLVIDVEYLYDDGEDRVAVVFTAREASDVRYFEVLKFSDVTETGHRLVSYTKTTEQGDIPKDARHLFDGPPPPEPLDIEWTVTGFETMRYSSVVSFYPGTTEEQVEAVRAAIRAGEALTLGELWSAEDGLTIAGVKVIASEPDYDKTWDSEISEYWVERIDGKDTGQEQPAAEPRKSTVYWLTYYEDFQSNTEVFTDRALWVAKIVACHSFEADKDPSGWATFDDDDASAAFRDAVETGDIDRAYALIKEHSPYYDGVLITWDEEEITC